jgi:hypothetical protein
MRQAAYEPHGDANQVGKQRKYLGGTADDRPGCMCGQPLACVCDDTHLGVMTGGVVIAAWHAHQGFIVKYRTVSLDRRRRVLASASTAAPEATDGVAAAAAMLWILVRQRCLTSLVVMKFIKCLVHKSV